VASKDPVKTVELSKPATSVAKPMDSKKPEVVKPVEPAKPEPVAAASDDTAVLDAVNAWAKAWSSQDVNQYLASYADSFKTPKGEPRKAWEATRRDRVSRPKTIAVEVNNAKVTMEGSDAAKVQFSQRYVADGKPQSTRKTLAMTKVGGAWLIQQEIAGR